MKFLTLLNPATGVVHIRVIKDDLEAEAQAEVLALSCGATLNSCDWMVADAVDIQPNL